MLLLHFIKNKALGHALFTSRKEYKQNRLNKARPGEKRKALMGMRKLKMMETLEIVSSKHFVLD